MKNILMLAALVPFLAHGVKGEYKEGQPTKFLRSLKESEQKAQQAALRAAAIKTSQSRTQSSTQQTEEQQPIIESTLPQVPVGWLEYFKSKLGLGLS